MYVGRVHIYVCVGVHVHACGDLKSASGIVSLEPSKHHVFRHRVSHLPGRLGLRGLTVSLALGLEVTTMSSFVCGFGV